MSLLTKKLPLLTLICALALFSIWRLTPHRGAAAEVLSTEASIPQTPSSRKQELPPVANRTELAIAPKAATVDWKKEFDSSSNYFDFVSKAAKKAFDGDGRAALYISKALYVCMPITREYAHSIDPEADFNAYWATRTKAPQWILDRALKDFQSCAGFFKGDAFAALPKRDGGGYDFRYWTDQANQDGDPLAQAEHAASDMYKTLSEKSSDANAKSLESAQVAINNAVASKDPAALFHAGLIFSDGRISNDPIQGFSLAIAACDLGYDCSANNTDNLFFGHCVSEGTCQAGATFSDVVTKAIGADGYAKAYARAQQIECALSRGDTNALQQLVQFKINH